MLENISDKVLKRVRLRFVSGIDCNGEIIYDNSYDLTEREDVSHLMHAINSDVKMNTIGFSIEVSSFENGEYDYSKLGENEFNPLVEYFIGETVGNELVIGNEVFHKMIFLNTVGSEIQLKHELTNLLSVIVENNSIKNIVDTYKKPKTKVYMYK